MWLWLSFFWFESCVSLFQRAIRHPEIRWFRNLSINMIRTHQKWRNVANFGAQPNGGLLRVRLISVPLLQVLRRSVCEGPTKMLHNKANRILQSQPHYSFRNTHSLHYLTHWREWLFMKRCSNYLINNVQTLDICLAPLFGVQSNPLRYLITTESAITPESTTVTNCS
jgi:hypothetical protein